MTIALRVPTFMKTCAAPASSHSTPVTSSSRARTFFFGPVMKLANGTVRAPRMERR